jgi:hypothetical protein
MTAYTKDKVLGSMDLYREFLSPLIALMNSLYVIRLSSSTSMGINLMLSDAAGTPDSLGSALISF